MFKFLGFDIGFDLIGEFIIVKVMVKFFDCLNIEGKLIKIIFYNLNFCVNEVIVIMLGNF